MPAYPYVPFLESAEEIRLLTIEPGEYDDSIKCGLANVSIREQPSYEALSYVWKSCDSQTPPPLDEEMTVAKAGIDGATTEKIRFGDMPDRWEYINLYHSAGGYYRPGIMICDGIEITIGGELYMALKRLRLADSSRVLWVDAVCINQDDLEERKLHVQFMGQIYTKAKKVLIWLGELHGLDSRGFETFETILDVLSRLHKAPKYQSRRELFMQDEKVRSMHWDQLSSLLRRSWFERVWVIQEISCATDAEVFIGNIRYHWNMFAAILTSLRVYDLDTYLEGDGWAAATRTVPLMTSLRKRFEQNARLPLLEILVSSRHFKCTLHHDKIYGILSLASDANQNYVNIDYTTDVSKVYTDFTVSHISKRNSLDILYACTKSGGTSDLTLPSWVPDWTQPCHHSPFFSIDLPSKAAGGSQIRVRFEDDSTSLFIHGKLVDTIHTVEELRRIPRIPRAGDSSYSSGRPRMFESKHMEYYEYNKKKSREWIANAMQIAFPDKTCTPDMYEALWRSWICNSTEEGTKPPPSWGERFSRFIQAQTLPDDEAAQRGFLTEWSRQYRDAYDLRLTVEDEDPHMHAMHDVLGFNSCAGKWCFNRRFFRTVAGRFGWAPDEARPGDQICVFYGGDYPFVLREGGSGCHEIVGDGYLHGFMDGEAMDCALEEREFHLV